MTERVELCREQHCGPVLPGVAKQRIYVECQLEKGHQGDHAAVWVNGWLEWNVAEQIAPV